MPIKRSALYLMIAFLFSLFSSRIRCFAANDLVSEAIPKIKNELAVFQIEETDLRTPAGWELPLTISPVENFFNQPLDVPLKGSEWSDSLENASTLSALLDVGYDILMSSKASNRNGARVEKQRFTEGPHELNRFLTEIYAAIELAQPLLKKANQSISKEARLGALSIAEQHVPQTGFSKGDISSRRIKQKYENMRDYSQIDLLQAGKIFFQAVDDNLSSLNSVKANKKFNKRFKTPLGVFLVRSAQKDIYHERDLKNVTVLIDLGGDNEYKTPPANAQEDQIRLVIDLGKNISINGHPRSTGGAGSGFFGIGALILPNAEGVKTIKTGSYSQGCGIGGIGALITKGQIKTSSELYSQGVGVFGIGLFSATQSTSSVYTTARMGQGAALVRGVGLFKHEGDNAEIRGGLSQPDPREPKGSVSMCQGVGFGQRAYSGGGVGLASIFGNNISVKGSYFSQGCGYWHAFGGFRIRGHQNTIQARRYDMGSGVHSAFGHFEALGDNNRLLNWGVGPAYGWDRSVGSALIAGNHNEVQVDWGAGVGSIGSLSFAYYKGENNRLKLNDIGRGHFYRNESSYSLQIIEGQNNQLESLGEYPGVLDDRVVVRDIRGAVRLRGVELTKKLGLTPAEWPDLPQGEELNQESINLKAKIREAEKKEPLEEIADLIDIAAAFSLDKQSPRQALERLLTLSPEKLGFLPGLVEPSATDQIIQWSFVFSAYGDQMIPFIIKELKQYSLQKQATLIHFSRVYSPSKIFPELVTILKTSSEKKIRSTVFKTMASLLNRDSGQEPGFRAAIDILEKALNHPESGAYKTQALHLLGRLHFYEGFGLLSVCSSTQTAEIRRRYLNSGPADLTSTIGDRGANELFSILEENRAENILKIKNEAAVLRNMETITREECRRVLKSPETSDIYSALLALGQISNPEDFNLIVPFFDHKTALIREAAAVALGRFGARSIPFLESVLSTGSLRSRVLVLNAAQQSTSDELIILVKKALHDPFPLVRLTATGLARDLPEVFSARKQEIINEIETRKKIEKNNDVVLALSLFR